MKIIWLIIEFIVASTLCSIPVLWMGNLNEQTLQQGMIVAMAFIIPSEIFRQWFPVETTLKTLQNKMNLFIGILLFVVGGPVTAFVSANWLDIIHFQQLKEQKEQLPIIIDDKLSSYTSIVPTNTTQLIQLPIINVPTNPTPKKTILNSSHKPVDSKDNSPTIGLISSVIKPDQEKVRLEFEGLNEYYYDGDNIEVHLHEIGSRSKPVDLWIAIKTPDKNLVFVPLNALNSINTYNKDFFTDKDYAQEYKPYASSVEPETKFHSKIIELKISLKKSFFSDDKSFFTQWGGLGDYRLYAVYVEEGKNPIKDNREYNEEHFYSNLLKQVFRLKKSEETILVEPVTKLEGGYEQASKERLQRNFRFIPEKYLSIQKFRLGNHKIMLQLKVDRYIYRDLMPYLFNKIYIVKDKFDIIDGRLFKRYDDYRIKNKFIVETFLPSNMNLLTISEYLSSEIKFFDSKLKELKTYSTKPRLRYYIRDFSEKETILSCQLVLTTIEVGILSRQRYLDREIKLKVEIFESFLTDFSEQMKKNLSDICYELKPLDDWKKEFKILIERSNAQ